MREGDLLELTIDRDGWDGSGRAMLEGVELSVPGAFAGEQVSARLLQLNRRKTLGRARLLQVISPHAGRCEPACSQHPGRGGRCDGCALMPLTLTAQREVKRALLAALGLHVTRVEGEDRPWGYRHSAKRVAFGGPGSLWLGSYRRGSHRGADMDGCRVDHPRLREAAELVQESARRLGIEPFDDRRGQGDLRYVWLRTDGEQAVVTLVTAEPDSRAARELPTLLPAWVGLAHSVQSERGNNLRGGEARTLREPTTLHVALDQGHLEAGPLGFMQPNPRVAARCYDALLRDEAGQPLHGRLALDLYAGSGVTTRMLRARFEDVVPNEVYPESAAALGVEPEPADACVERLVTQRRPVDLVVANPPRAGLTEATCQALLRLNAPRLHLMSCGPEALARDLRLLTETGSYRVAGLRAFDTLPQTPHVELVAHLVRSGPATLDG